MPVSKKTEVRVAARDAIAASAQENLLAGAVKPASLARLNYPGLSTSTMQKTKKSGKEDDDDGPVKKKAPAVRTKRKNQPLDLQNPEAVAQAAAARPAREAVMLDDDDEDEPVIRKPPPDFHFEELHDVTPNFFIRVLARRTCPCLWLFLSIGFGALAILLATAPWGMSSFPTRGGDNDRADIRTQKNDAALALKGSVTFAAQPSLSSLTTLEQQERASGALWLLYDGTEKGNVLTSDSLERMRGIEGALMTSSNFAGRDHWLTGEPATAEQSQREQTFGGETRQRSYQDFCVLEKDSCTACARACRPPASVLNVLYPVGGEITLSRSTACPATMAANLSDFKEMTVDGVEGACAAKYASCSGLVGDKLSGCLVNNGEGSVRVGDVDAAFTAAMFDGAGAVKAEYGFFFDDGFSASNLKSTVTRSVLYYGRPIAGFSTAEGGEVCKDAQPAGKVGEVVVPGFERAPSATQRQLTEEYFGYVVPFLDKEYQDKNHFQFYYYCSDMVWPIISEIFVHDALLATGSLVFVFAYMWLHTNSGILAGAGMLHILGSFPCAFLLYRYMLGIRAFYFLNFLAIYIILAIGADDVFVMIDAWKQSADIEAINDVSERKRLVARMSWVFRKAAKAMAITSSTTIVAFGAAATSTILQVQCFGAFTAMLVFMNYIFVITWYPTVIISWHRNVESKKPNPCDLIHCCACCACILAKECSPDARAKAEAKKRAQKKRDKKDKAEKKAAEDAGLAPPPKEEGKKKNNHIDSFCTDRYGPWLVNGNAKKVVAFFILLAVFMGYCCKDLLPTSQPDELLPASHPLQATVSLWNGPKSPFRGTQSDAMVQVQSVWGLLPAIVDQTGIDPYSENDAGELQLDEAFDMSKAITQSFLAKTCDDFRANAALVRQGVLPNQADECLCLSNDLFAFYKSKNPNATDTTVPAATYFDTLTDFLETTALGYRHLQHGTVDIVGAGDARKSTFSMIVCNSTLKASDGAFTYYKPAYLEWEKAMEAINVEGGDAPNTARFGFQTTVGGQWVKMHTGELYLSNAITSTITSAALAYLILIISTANILVATIALVDIAGVCVCILGSMALVGWQFGLTESICCSILVGLSVDYAVHLANAYMESHSPFRNDRVKSALGEMGMTVVGGAVTSIGSSSLLFACYLQFFFKFGLFMCATIIFSMLWSLGFFMAMLAWVGPEGLFGTCGPLLTIARWTGHRLVRSPEKELSEEEEAKQRAKIVALGPARRSSIKTLAHLKRTAKSGGVEEEDFSSGKKEKRRRRQYIPSRTGGKITKLTDHTVQRLFDTQTAAKMVVTLTTPQYPEEPALSELANQYHQLSFVRCDADGVIARHFRTLVGRAPLPLKMAAQSVFLKWKDRETPQFYWLDSGFNPTDMAIRCTEMAGLETPIEPGAKVAAKMVFTMMSDVAVPGLITTVESTMKCPYCDCRNPHQPSRDWVGKQVIVCKDCGVTLTEL